MKFIDLIQSVTWNEVEKSFIEHYGHHYQKYKKRIKKKKLNKFKSAFDELLLIIPKDTEWRIVVTKVIEDGEVYVDVSGLDGKFYKDSPDFNPEMHSEYAEEEVCFGLGFTSWDEWLGMRVEKESFKDFNRAEVIAHCLWELTFYGFSSTKE